MRIEKKRTTLLGALALVFIFACVSAFLFPKDVFASDYVKKDRQVETVSWGASSNTTLLIKTKNGEVWGAGYNTKGIIDRSSTTNVLSPIKITDNAKDVFSTGTMSYVIKKDSTLWGMGTSSKEPSKLVTGADRFVEQSGCGMKAKLYYYLAEDSTLRASDGSLVASDVTFAARDDDSSACTTLYLLSNGTLKADGDKYLASGVSLTNVKSADVGHSNSFATAVKTDNNLWAWSNKCRTPKNISNGIISATSGDSSIMGIKTDGSLWKWTTSNTLEQISATKVMDDVSQIKMARNYQAAIKTDNSLWMWGDNSFGQLGTGNTNSANSPVKVMDDVSKVFLGQHCVAVIKTDGSLWTWGGNQYGELGLGVVGNVTTPTKVDLPKIEIPVYDINATAGPGGTISDEGQSQVEEGSSIEYTITPNDGYAIKDVIVDGNSVGKTSSFIFDNITEDHTIYATFSYTGDAGDGPSDTPSSDQNDGKKANWYLSGPKTIYLIPFFFADEIDIKGNYDKDELSFSVSSSAPDVLTAYTEWDYVHLNPHKAGKAVLTVSDSEGVQKRFAVTVKRVPLDFAKNTIDNATYTGKSLKTKIWLWYGEYNLVNESDYSAKYYNNKNVGKATALLSGKGDFEGSVKLSFKILPKGTTFTTVTSGKKKMTVKWKKQTIQTSGYQMRYSTSKKFKSNVKMILVKNKNASKKVIKKLKAKKKYYVQIRTYKNVGKEKYYSKWSKVKKVKIK